MPQGSLAPSALADSQVTGERRHVLLVRTTAIVWTAVLSEMDKSLRMRQAKYHDHTQISQRTGCLGDHTVIKVQRARGATTQSYRAAITNTDGIPHARMTPSLRHVVPFVGSDDILGMISIDLAEETYPPLFGSECNVSMMGVLKNRGAPITTRLSGNLARATA
jgi:hypothetical protein